MESALRVLANAVRSLKAGDRDGIAALLAGLLASLDLANASSQTEVLAQSYSSGGG